MKRRRPTKRAAVQSRPQRVRRLRRQLGTLRSTLEKAKSSPAALSKAIDQIKPKLESVDWSLAAQLLLKGERRKSAKRQQVKAPAAAKPMKLAHSLAVEPPPRDPYIRKLELPKLPGGMQVGRDMGGMAMDDASGAGAFPYAGYLGAGGPGGNFNLYFPGYPYLAMLTQRSEYRQPTETHAKDMTREWIEFKSQGGADKAKRIKEIEDAFTARKVQQIAREALIHDGFYGVGHIAIDIKDNEDTTLPILLDPKSIPKGSLRAFRNIEPMWVTPIVWNSTDPLSESFYVPETWVALDRTMHKTRLLQVISREVPDIIKPAYNFGGISMSQLIEPYVDRWLKTVAGVNRLINNFSLIFLKTDMSAVLQGDSNGQELLSRLKLARMHGDNMGAFLLDMAKEELGQVQVSLSGLSELQAQAQEHMAAPTHLPLVVLTGITPSGLNASSDGEIEVYHDWNRSEQYAVLAPVLTHMMHIIMLDLWGEIDKDITFGFKPIKQVTGEALARIKKTQSEQDVAYIDAGVVDRQEVREKVARDPDSGYTNLDVEKLPEEPDGGPDDGEGPFEQEAGAMDSIALDEWEESKHPRGEGGRFGTGGSGGKSMPKPKLTSKEKTYLSSYSGDDFFRLNKELRSGDSDDPAVKLLDSAIAKGSVPAGTTLYRGMSIEAAKKLFPDGNIEVGQTVSDKGFMSTSKSANVAQSWGMGGVVLKINAKNGAKGLDLDGIARAGLEKEVLLPRDARVTVTRISKGKQVGSPVVVEVSYGEREELEEAA